MKKPQIIKQNTFTEFFRELLHNWQENQLLNELNQSQKEIKAEKGKILESLKNLK